MTDTQDTPTRSDSTRSSPPASGWLWVDNRVLEDHDLSATELAVYVAICRVVTEGEGWAPRERLAELAGCQWRAVADALRTLEDEGLIASYARYGDDGRQLANGYRVADFDTPPMHSLHPPHARDASEEDTGEEDPPPPARAESEIVDNSPSNEPADYEGAFRWMAAVDDEDKASAAAELAAHVSTRLFEPINEADHADVVDAAVAAAFPDSELTGFQRNHLHRTLSDVDGESRWTWTVAAVAVAAVLGLDVMRTPSVLDGWRTAKERAAGGVQGDGRAGDPPTIDDDRAADRPTSLEEAQQWATDHGFTERVGTGLWKTVGCRGWTMAGQLGPQGETIGNLAGWTRANKNALLQAARGASPSH